MASSRTVIIIDETDGTTLLKSPERRDSKALSDLVIGASAGPGESAKPHRPRRLVKRHIADLLYVYWDYGAAPAACAAHELHMNLVRVARLSHGWKCASAENLSPTTPAVKPLTPPDDPWGPPCAMAHPAELVLARAGRTGV